MYLLLPLFFSFVLSVLQHFFLPQIKEIWRIGIELQTLFSIIPEIQQHKQGILFIWQDMNPNIKTKQGHIKEYIVSQTLKCFTEKHKRDDHWSPAPSHFTIFPGIQGPNFRKITLTQAPDQKKPKKPECHKSENSHSNNSNLAVKILSKFVWLLIFSYWFKLNLWDRKQHSFPLKIPLFYTLTCLISSHPNTLYGLINTENKNYFFLPCYTELKFK